MSQSDCLFINFKSNHSRHQSLPHHKIICESVSSPTTTGIGSLASTRTRAHSSGWWWWPLPVSSISFVSGKWSKISHIASLCSIGWRWEIVGLRPPTAQISSPATAAASTHSTISTTTLAWCAISGTIGSAICSVSSISSCAICRVSSSRARSSWRARWSPSTSTRWSTVCAIIWWGLIVHRALRLGRGWWTSLCCSTSSSSTIVVWIVVAAIVLVHVVVTVIPV